MSPTMIWLSKGGQRQGPMPIADAQARVASGDYQSSDLAWIVGTPAWTSIANCSQLAAGAEGNAPQATSPVQAGAADLPMPDWLPHTAAPISWARFAARYLDRSLIALVSSFVGAFAVPSLSPAHSKYTIGSFVGPLLIIWLLGITLTLLYETCAIHYFGATVGKYLFRIRVKGLDTTQLSLGQSFKRAALVMSVGSAFMIPILSFLTYIAAYSAMENSAKGASWDAASGAVVYGKTNVRAQRLFVCLACFVALFVTWGRAMAPYRHLMQPGSHASAPKVLQK